MADTTNITEIGGQKYTYEFVLFCPPLASTDENNSQNKISFNHTAIKVLDITENLFEPFVDGMVIIANPYNYIDSLYSVRGDGTDVFKVKLRPVITPSVEGAGSSINEQLADCELNYEFVVTSEDNVVDEGSRAGNLKVYALRDRNASILNEEFPHSQRFRGKIGDIIKKILTDKLGADKIGLVFEAGDFNIDKFPEHIIPAGSFRYMDALKYLLRYYYFKDGEVYVKGFLDFDREHRRYELKPVSTQYYARNKETTIESFDVGQVVYDKNIAFINDNNPVDIAPSFSKYIGVLTNSNLTTPMVDYSNSYFMNAQVTGYDPILGEFGIREIRVEELKEKWKSKFVDCFTVLQGKPKPHLNLNKLKKEKGFKLYTSPYNIEDTAHMVEAEMINSFNFYNLQLIISTVGQTFRTSGKFIDLIKAEPTSVDYTKTQRNITSKQQQSSQKEQTNLEDQKLVGRWLMTQVRHLFIDKNYRNEVYCTKTYVGDSFNEDDSIDNQYNQDR